VPFVFRNLLGSFRKNTSGFPVVAVDNRAGFGFVVALRIWAEGMNRHAEFA